MKNKNQLKQQLDKIYFKKCDENNIPYYGARDIIDELEDLIILNMDNLDQNDINIFSNTIESILDAYKHISEIKGYSI